MSAPWRFAPRADETPRQRSRRIGEAKAVFDRIRCDFPPHTDAVEDVLSILYAAEDRAPGEACGGGFLLAPTGVGKSETLRTAERMANVDAAEGERPALRIEISVRGTTDSVPQAILREFGAKRPEAGTESSQWERAVELMKRHRVGILLIDEFNRAARRPTISAAIALSIQQHIMDAPVCPVVFAGSEKAGTVMRSAPAVHERLDDSIDLQPLVWQRDGDKALMREFLAELDVAMVEAGLLTRSSGLAEGDVPRLLCRATQGKLRAIVKTVRAAMVLALQRGATSIARSDLEVGVRRYCIRQKLVGRNPFSEPDPSTAKDVGKGRVDVDVDESGDGDEQEGHGL